MSGETESNPEQEVAELMDLHPDVAVQREMIGFMDIIKNGEDGYTAVERLQVHPLLDGEEQSASVKLYTDLDAGGSNGKVGVDLKVTLGEDGVSTVTVKQAEAGVDVDGVMQLAQQGFELFDRYRALPKDARFKIPASKVHDEAKGDMAGYLESAGIEKGVARGMAGGEDESPEGQYRVMQPVIAAEYHIESAGA